jgi:hypothetical protein
MATTTNYGWTTPDDTALVKDGAAAIRTLGTSVDTTTKNLNPSTTLGDIEYRSSTANTNTRLGIGTSGQVLTVAAGVPAWSTIGGASLVFIQSATATAATTLTMDGVFTSTYKNYLIVGSFDGSTDATTRIRFRTSASDNATANYNYAVFFNPNSGALSGTGGGTGDDNGKFANHGSSGTCYFSATIFNPEVAEQTGWLSNGYRFSSARTDHFGNFSATTQFDGFKLYPDSGTFTGTVRLYGLANS